MNKYRIVVIIKEVIDDLSNLSNVITYDYSYSLNLSKSYIGDFLQ